MGIVFGNLGDRVSRRKPLWLEANEKSRNESNGENESEEMIETLYSRAWRVLTPTKVWGAYQVQRMMRINQGECVTLSGNSFA